MRESISQCAGCAGRGEQQAGRWSDRREDRSDLPEGKDECHSDTFCTGHDFFAAGHSDADPGTAEYAAFLERV